MTWEVSCGRFWSYCRKIHSHVGKGKRQQVMERSLFRLEFQLPDGKDTLQTERRCYELKIQSFCKCYLQ